MLPGRDGHSIVRELRRRGDTTLVLMPTAGDGLDAMVKALQARANGYQVKPFRMGELEARIRSLEQRSDRA